MSRTERRVSIHLYRIKKGNNESLAEFMKRCYQEVVLILDLDVGVAYTSFLNGLRSGCLRFSLSKQKETTLAKALKKVADFISATVISAESGDGPRRGRLQKRNLTWAEQRQRNKGHDQCFP